MSATALQGIYVSGDDAPTMPQEYAQLRESEPIEVLGGSIYLFHWPLFAILMLGVCLLACVVPTRRALSVEPTVALRAEFPMWAGWMLKPEQRILLVTQDSADVDAVFTNGGTIADYQGFGKRKADKFKK